MIQWYLTVKNLIRALTHKAFDALELYKQGGKEVTGTINGYMKSAYEQLQDLWKENFADEVMAQVKGS